QGVQVSATQLSFVAFTGGDAPPSQSVTILSAGQNAVNYSLQTAGTGLNGSAPAWLHLSQSGGTSPGVLVVSTDQTGLAASSTPYTASISVQLSGAGGNTQNSVTVSVSLIV